VPFLAAGAAPRGEIRREARLGDRLAAVDAQAVSTLGDPCARCVERGELGEVQLENVVFDGKSIALEGVVGVVAGGLDRPAGVFERLAPRGDALAQNSLARLDCAQQSRKVLSAEMRGIVHLVATSGWPPSFREIGRGPGRPPRYARTKAPPISSWPR
jgi:hypothetical protein